MLVNCTASEEAHQKKMWSTKGYLKPMDLAFTETSILCEYLCQMADGTFFSAPHFSDKTLWMSYS